MEIGDEMFKRICLTVFLVITFVLTGCAPKSPEDNTLKLGVIPLIINFPVYVAEEEGLFAEHNLEVEIVPINSTAAQMSAFQSEEVDGILQHIFATAILNKDAEMGKLIGASVMPVFDIVISEGSDITNVEDLKHKEIAVATNTMIDYALERLLVEEGIDITDITKVNVPIMPSRLELLNQGTIPVAILSSPLSDLAVLNGGRIIVNDINEPFAGPGLVFTQSALENKSEAIGRFLNVWQQMIELINNDPEKYQDLFNEVARVPEEVSKDLKVPTFPKLELPTSTEVESVLGWMIGKGIISEPLPYDEIVDTQYLK